jgi:hypothetical protein
MIKKIKAFFYILRNYKKYKEIKKINDYLY